MVNTGKASGPTGIQQKWWWWWIMKSLMWIGWMYCVI